MSFKIPLVLIQLVVSSFTYALEVGVVSCYSSFISWSSRSNYRSFRSYSLASTSLLVEKAFILIPGGADTLSIVEEASLSVFLAILVANNVVFKHAPSVCIGFIFKNLSTLHTLNFESNLNIVN